MKKKLIRAANKIVELENKLALGKDVEGLEEEIEKIMESFSPEEMAEIDEYIMGKQLLP